MNTSFSLVPLLWCLVFSLVVSKYTNNRIIQPISAVVDLDKRINKISHFWKSTGFCPPSPHTSSWRWFGGESMKQNLLYIGALPYGAIEQVRMHWLLDLITISGGVYNFSALDELLDQLHEAGLRPGFELMGNPGGIFTDFEDSQKVTLWRDLVYTLAKHYINRYGYKYVSTWNFETWNEPKIGHFDGMNITIKGFLNYYDACAAGLTMVGSRLQLGGPGGECKKFRLDRYCWAWLDHIQNGKDYFTGKPPYLPDFISIHKKGEEPNNTDWILQKEEATIRHIHSHFPRLSQVPIFNDEADPLVGWIKPKWWRADSTYAAMVAKIVVAHHRKCYKENCNVRFSLLSNDNGFLSYQPEVFTQRTLLARFQLNSTSSPSVQMITKPVYTVMGLLAFLGDQEIQVTLKGEDLNDAVGIMATYRNGSSKCPHQSEEWSILVYNSNDTYNSSTTADICLSFAAAHKPFSEDTKINVYQIDNFHGNPYHRWVQIGRPLEPNDLQLAHMRKEEVLSRTLGPATFSIDQPLQLQVPQPGVSLIQICSKPHKPPAQVQALKVHPVNSKQVLITWDDSLIKTRCLLTYIILHSSSGQKHTYKRINSHYIIFNYFVVKEDTIPGSGETRFGFYRVRAIDQWNRKGALSPPTYYSDR